MMCDQETLRWAIQAVMTARPNISALDALMQAQEIASGINAMLYVEPIKPVVRNNNVRTSEEQKDYIKEHWPMGTRTKEMVAALNKMGPRLFTSATLGVHASVVLGLRRPASSRNNNLSRAREIQRAKRAA